MFKIIFSSLWYLLPAALGNHNASCGNRLWLQGLIKKILAKFSVPIDFGIKIKGKELFGRNKTWRGFIVGIITGVLISGIQALLYYRYNFFQKYTIVDYRYVNFVIFGSLMGAGALIGDLIESFIKRRFNKPSGRPWFPWDQVDWIIGSMLLSSIVFIPAKKTIIVTLILYIIVHLCSDRVVYWLGIKKREEVN